MTKPLKTKIEPGRPGLLVRKPEGGHLAADGETVTWSTYWQRRLDDGDVKIPARTKADAKPAARAEKE